jgi:outer membrane protein TolC
VQAQDQMIQWNNYVGALKRSLETIDRRASQGAAPRADVDTALSRLRQAQAGLEANRGVLLTNRAQLASLLNAAPGSLAWPDEATMLSDRELAAFDADRIKLHPAHLAAEAQVEEQKGQARGARASLWPELSLQHRRQLDGTEFDPSNDATLFVLSFQTNNGVQGLFGYQAERQRIAAVQAQLRAADQDVTSTLAIDKAQLAAVGAQLEVQYEAAKSSSALVDSFIRQFEAGRKSWLEVLNAQREANDAMIQSITVRRNYWMASEKLALDGMYWDRFGAEIISDTGDGTGK